MGHFIKHKPDIFKECSSDSCRPALFFNLLTTFFCVRSRARWCRFSNWIDGQINPKFFCWWYTSTSFCVLWGAVLLLLNITVVRENLWWLFWSMVSSYFDYSNHMKNSIRSEPRHFLTISKTTIFLSFFLKKKIY